MKTMFAIFVLLFLNVLQLNADVISALLQLKVPILFIETVNGELPSCEYVNAPAGCDGYGIVNKTKVPGRLYIVQSNDTIYDSGEYVMGESGMTFRLRGNTSAYNEKKPYKIKLQQKADLLCRGDKRFKDKDWVLLGKHDIDLLAGYEVSRLVGMPWTPSFCYVNVIINGEYAGLYQLAENVGKNRDCRLDIDEHTGFIAERDAYWWNAEFFLQSNLSRYYYTLKFPDNDEVTQADSMRIQNRLLQMEQSIIDGTYPQFIDVDNFAAWMLVHDIVGTRDAGGSNMFLSRHDDLDETLIQMPVIWDLDGIMWRDGHWASAHTDSVTLFPLLFASKNRSFTNAYIARWNDIKDGLALALTSNLQSFVESELGKDIAKSAALDAERGHYPDDWQFNIDRAFGWYTQHTMWLTTAISQVEKAETSIDFPIGENAGSVLYNLNGQKVTPGYRGITVCSGRKYLNP